jgi:hypothetical protein
MTKPVTALACVLIGTCTLALAQKRSIPSHPSGSSSGSGCGPVTTKSNGSKGPQTTTANCRSENPASLPAQGMSVGRLANQKLEKATPRPGTPDFLPNSPIVSGNQLP